MQEALNLISQVSKKGALPLHLVQIKYNILMRQGRYEEALRTVQRGIKRSGERQELLAAQCHILIRLKNYQGALQTALKKDQLTKRKNPWEAVNIANIYLRLENKIEALNWLDEAVRRGFIDYRLFEQNRYKPLLLEKKFLALIEEIKLIIGLGEKAKDFTAPLLTGESFTLSERKGKVVLIYFWATWCKPCRQEMKYLKSYYSQTAQKGFDIIGINLDSDGKILKEYLQKVKIPWKTISSGKAWKGDVVTLYGVNSLPSAWVIDRAGYLRSFGLKGKALVDAIDTLVTEK